MQPEGESEIEQVISMTDTYDPIVYGRFAGRAELLGVQADMHITRLELSDAGVYTCEVYFYADKETGSGNTNLHISQLVDQISILGYGETRDRGESSYYFPPGEPNSLQCEATMGKPAAKLHWYKGLNEVQQHGETIEENVDGTFNTISLLQFTPEDSDHGEVLKCESDQQPDLDLTKAATIMINTNGAVTSAISVTLLAFSLMVGHLTS
uniref:Cell adhesion molecule 3-like n=1 Tax=Saccoglossus kowalevskii TaxID=10224 RepID=A0ABM0MWF8_SACKO|nr:PREDICTED: cell adhesion molecule 3-like [Saccoglossus kowalevskii]